MRNIRLPCRRISIWIILTLQILLIGSYFVLQTENPNRNLNQSVSFVVALNNSLVRNKVTYQTIHNRVTLQSIESANFFVDFNSSLCYKYGSDLKAMHRSKSFNWKCKCLSGWHGNDCGQPEVIWRALLANRKAIPLKGPRKYLRRIIYILESNEFTETTTDIRINDLHSIIDLFVLYEDATSAYFQNKLMSDFLKEYHDKILYLKSSNLKNAWSTVKELLVNLSEDDIILVGGPNDIPNGLALQYFKLYDKWPQPLMFRFRWSVYGFFWLHPSKTTLKGGACTVAYLYETLNENIQLVYNKTRELSKGLIIGDLNHFGGWFCEYCYESLQIIKLLNRDPPLNIVTFNSVDMKKVDNAYVEDLIENGIYLDGKTELLRTHRYRENYFAPTFVTNNSWKYDWLLINLYSKMDYY